MTVRRLSDVPPTGAEAPGVEVRNLKRVEDVELKVLDVKPGSSTPFHAHPHAHEGVIVSGTGAVRYEDRSDLLSPGDVFSVNPHEPHAIDSRGPDVLRLVCMDCFIE